MAHKTIEDLEQELTQAARVVRVGRSYAHYKHPDRPYEVTGFVVLEATDEVAVRYAPSDNPILEFVRPLDSWLASVEFGGKTIPRFTALN